MQRLQRLRDNIRSVYMGDAGAVFDRRPVSVWAETFNPAGSDYEHDGAADVLLEMQDGLRVQYSGSFVGSTACCTSNSR